MQFVLCLFILYFFAATLYFSHNDDKNNTIITRLKLNNTLY